MSAHVAGAPDFEVRTLLDEARRSVASIRDEMDKQVSELKKDLAGAKSEIAALKRKKTGPND